MGVVFIYIRTVFDPVCEYMYEHGSPDLSDQTPAPDVVANYNNHNNAKRIATALTWSIMTLEIGGSSLVVIGQRCFDRAPRC